MYTFVLAYILSATPPTFAFLEEYDSMADCQKGIQEEIEKEFQNEVGCMVLVKPEDFNKMKGV